MAREKDKVQNTPQRTPQSGRRGMRAGTGEEEEQGQTFRFELMAGQHIEANKNAKPKRRRVIDPETGEEAFEAKYPSITYNPGDIIETDTDLAAKFGNDKFRNLDVRGTMVYGKTRVPQQKEPPRGLPVKDPHDREEFDEGELQQEMIGAGAKTGEDLGLEVTEEPEGEEREQDDNPKRVTDKQTDDANLDDMTVTELRAHAEERGIDLSKSHRKSDMVDTIKRSGKRK